MALNYSISTTLSELDQLKQDYLSFDVNHCFRVYDNEDCTSIRWEDKTNWLEVFGRVRSCERNNLLEDSNLSSLEAWEVFHEGEVLNTDYVLFGSVPCGINTRYVNGLGLLSIAQNVLVPPTPHTLKIRVHYQNSFGSYPGSLSVNFGGSALSFPLNQGWNEIIYTGPVGSSSFDVSVNLSLEDVYHFEYICVYESGVINPGFIYEADLEILHTNCLGQERLIASYPNIGVNGSGVYDLFNPDPLNYGCCSFHCSSGEEYLADGLYCFRLAVRETLPLHSQEEIIDEVDEINEVDVIEEIESSVSSITSSPSLGIRSPVTEEIDEITGLTRNPVSPSVIINESGLATITVEDCVYMTCAQSCQEDLYPVVIEKSANYSCAVNKYRKIGRDWGKLQKELKVLFNVMYLINNYNLTKEECMIVRCYVDKVKLCKC
jgi:hypothetical protein